MINKREQHKCCEQQACTDEGGDSWRQVPLPTSGNRFRRKRRSTTSVPSSVRISPWPSMNQLQLKAARKTEKQLI